MNGCFAYTNRGCKALKFRNCEGCSFYKTEEEAEAGRAKAVERILSLNRETREHINETYYGGKLEV